MAMAAWKGEMMEKIHNKYVNFSLYAAEYRRSLDLRVFREKLALARKLKCLTLWRLATERSHTLKKEQHAYVVSKRGNKCTYC